MIHNLTIQFAAIVGSVLHVVYITCIYTVTDQKENIIF
jgi:hypothetical protein